jgi:hypothetical protein
VPGLPQLNDREEVTNITCSDLYASEDPRYLRRPDMVAVYSVPPGLTFTNSTFCPHIVFMCVVWNSEQTAIISPYNIN